MSITKIYEICCDECGATYHGDWTIKDTEENFISEGGIVKGKKHYCDTECYNREKRGKKKRQKFLNILRKVRRKIIRDIYNNDDNARNAILFLCPNFEYSDWSYKSVNEFIRYVNS